MGGLNLGALKAQESGRVWGLVPLKNLEIWYTGDAIFRVFRVRFRQCLD